MRLLQASGPSCGKLGAVPRGPSAARRQVRGAAAAAGAGWRGALAPHDEGMRHVPNAPADRRFVGAWMLCTASLEAGPQLRTSGRSDTDMFSQPASKHRPHLQAAETARAVGRCVLHKARRDWQSLSFYYRI